MELQSLRHLPLPSLIVGDFNCNPFLLDCGDDLDNMGFRDFKSIYLARYGTRMPQTCRDATWPDDALCCPKVGRWINSFQVLPTYYFDTHKVVVAELKHP